MRKITGFLLPATPLVRHAQLGGLFSAKIIKIIFEIQQKIAYDPGRKQEKGRFIWNFMST